MVSLIKGIESSLENKTEDIEENKYISSSKEPGDKDIGELQAHFESLLKEGEKNIEGYKENQQEILSKHPQEVLVEQSGKSLEKGQQETFSDSALFTQLTNKFLKEEKAPHTQPKDIFYSNSVLPEPSTEKLKKKLQPEVSFKDTVEQSGEGREKRKISLEGDEFLKEKVEKPPLRGERQDVDVDVDLALAKQVHVGIKEEMRLRKGEEVFSKGEGLGGQSIKAEDEREISLGGDKSLKDRVEVTPKGDQQGLSYRTDLGSAKQRRVGIKETKEKEKRFNEEQDVSLKPSSEDLVSTIIRNYFPEAKGEEKVVSSNLSSEKRLVEVANEIAERIFVSEKKVDGSQEIRIFLKDSVLPQTEVRVFKKDDIVHIAFHTSSQEAHRLLLDNRENLNNYLHQQLGDNINIEINFFSSQAEANTEGRSRERRFVYEEIEG